MHLRLFEILVGLLNRVWANTKQWQVAHTVLLAKSGETDQPKNLRPISVTNSESRIFFSMLMCRLTDYMTKNCFLKPGDQKGFMPKILVAMNTRS
jgi:hypothetical protein